MLESEEATKREIVSAWFCGPECMENVLEPKKWRTLPSGKTTPEALHAFLKWKFAHAAFEPVLVDLLARAPLIVWRTWNTYLAVAAGAVASPAYAQNLLALAREFVRATDPAKAAPAMLARFKVLARTRDAWPGVTAKVDWVRADEKKKLQLLHLSSAHRSKPLSPGHCVTVQLEPRAQKAINSLSAMLVDAPPLVHQTQEAYFQLAASDSSQADYPDLVLHLACEFVAAVDPSTATSELLENFKRLSEECLEWPGWLTRPKFVAEENRKLNGLPLGAAWGTEQFEEKPSAPVLVAQRLLACLHRISEMRFHGDQCVEQCNVDKCLKLPCDAPECPWRGKSRPSRVVRPPRFFWDFHKFSRTKPPLDSDPVHADIWLAVAGSLLDCAHGPVGIRSEARSQHYRAFNNNPTVIIDSLSRIGYRIGSPCPPADHEYFGENQQPDSEPSIIPAQPTGRNAFRAEGPPCILAYSHVNAYCLKGVDQGVKTDTARYGQFRKDVLARLRARLPKPQGILAVFPELPEPLLNQQIDAVITPKKERGRVTCALRPTKACLEIARSVSVKR